MAEFPIRTEWMFDVRSACQRFGCKTFQADRSDFEAAVGDLFCAVSPPESLQEADALRALLKIGAVASATAFHQEYHRRRADALCPVSPVEAALHVWSQYDEDPRITWGRWAKIFLAAFDTTHPSSPAVRAAAILRGRFRNPLTLTELATMVGTSRTVLTAEFRKQYGLSPGEYRTRVRLRWFVNEVRAPGANAGRLAEQAGYATYHNLLDALRARTGIVPSAIKSLADNDARELIDAKLALSGLCGRSPHHQQIKNQNVVTLSIDTPGALYPHIDRGGVRHEVRSRPRRSSRPRPLGSPG